MREMTLLCSIGLLVIVGATSSKRVYRLLVQAAVCVAVLYLWCVVTLEGSYVEQSGLTLDSLGANLCLLTVILSTICVCSSWNRASLYVGILLLVEGICLGAFSVTNLWYFYVFFECVLVPMYVLVIRFGSKDRKRKALSYLLVYTVGGLLCMLVALASLQLLVGSLEIGAIQAYVTSQEGAALSSGFKSLIWVLLVVGMLVKVPLFGLHVWLSEAHVEAPTEGLVVLAGVLLKLGTYGIWRFNVECLGSWGDTNVGVLRLLCVVGVCYTLFTALRQTDIKRVIAYGSVGHMCVVVLGLVSGTLEGELGGLIQMVLHGVVSGGLFLLIGVIYSKGGSKELGYVSGLGESMPVYSLLLFALVCGNVGIPLTSGFIGELLLVCGIWLCSKVLGLVVGVGMLVTGGYSLYLYNRMVTGNTSSSVVLWQDVSRKEWYLSLVLVVLLLVIGVSPRVVL